MSYNPEEAIQEAQERVEAFKELHEKHPQACLRSHGRLSSYLPDEPRRIWYDENLTPEDCDEFDIYITDTQTREGGPERAEIRIGFYKTLDSGLGVFCNPLSTVWPHSLQTLDDEDKATLMRIFRKAATRFGG